MVDIQKLLEQMPLFENPHFSIEGNGFIDYPHLNTIKLLIEQSNRFTQSKPDCHVLETLDTFEVHLFDRTDEPLKPDTSFMVEPKPIITSSYFKKQDGALAYREIVIVFKRYDRGEKADENQ